MAKVTINPVTRIEGHLKIETEVAQGKVMDAWSSGTLFRGIELILKGRVPEDAWLFTQRLCGVCTYVHGSTSVRCIENAYKTEIPGNARTIRNLLMGGQFIHDHLIHFYQLHALDWVDLVKALAADPAKTAELAKSISPNADLIDFNAVKTRLKTFVDSGQLGIFSNGYWGHAAYLLTPEENLLFMAHYLEALRKQVIVGRMHAIWGGKNPHLQSLRVGGFTCKEEVTSFRISDFRKYLVEIKKFVDTVYIPDVILLAKKYLSWGTIGGSQNFMAFGEFPLGNSEPADLFFPQGIIVGGQAAGVSALDTSLITEHVKHSWYAGSANPHPASGTTEPSYTPYDTSAKYSWLKAPRYAGKPMEVGPLARMLVAYGKGMAQAVSSMQQFFSATGLDINTMNSTLGRTAARALETQIIANEMGSWLDQLDETGSAYTPPAVLTDAQGVGLNEAPRGAVGHWAGIQGGKIGNYQMVIPSGWNFSPRCGAEIPGPVEKALVGTPVADMEKPVEVLRTVHSFDPCIGCAVHVIDPLGDKTFVVKAA